MILLIVAIVTQAYISFAQEQYAIDPRLPFRTLLPGQLAGLSIYDKGKYDEFETQAGYYKQLAELIGGWEKIDVLARDPEAYEQAIKDATRLSNLKEEQDKAKATEFTENELDQSVPTSPCAAGVLTAQQKTELQQGKTVLLSAEQNEKLRSCYASTTPAWSFDTTISVIQFGLEDLDPAPLNLPAIPIDGVTEIGTITPPLDFLIPTTTTYSPINPLNPLLPRNALDQLWYPETEEQRNKDCFKLIDGPYNHPKFPNGFYFDNCGRAIPAEYFRETAPSPPPTEPPLSSLGPDGLAGGSTGITFPPGFIFGTPGPNGPDVIRTGEGTFVNPDNFARRRAVRI